MWYFAHLRLWTEIHPSCTHYIHVVERGGEGREKREEKGRREERHKDTPREERHNEDHRNRKMEQKVIRR